LAVCAYAEPVKALTIIRDVAITMVKRATIVVPLVNVTIVIDAAAIFFKNMKQNIYVKQLTYLVSTILLISIDSMRPSYETLQLSLSL
jgi:uncharacterized protein YqgC (DUF456 family)